VRRNLEAIRFRECEPIREEVGEDEDRDFDTSAPELGTLFQGHDGQRVGAGFEGGSGNGDGAVSVRVGLHDGHKEGVPGTAFEAANVVPDRT
jgi:hypothetical protein